MVARRSGGSGIQQGEILNHHVGNALVVYGKERMSDTTYRLASAVPPDPDNDLVVVDLPGAQPITAWEAVVGALPGRRRGVRLVLGGRSRETSVLAGQWLADRLGRTVIAPDGAVVQGANGTLLVHGGERSGWVRFEKRKKARWDSKRFPRPSWDTAEVAEEWCGPSGTVADPLPCGMWLRPGIDPTSTRRHRNRLIRDLPCQRDSFAVVVGYPGGTRVEFEDLVALWLHLPAGTRKQARLVCYGPVELPEGVPAGQVLADRVAEPVVCYNGMPVGSADDPGVHTIRSGGEFGWQPFARQMRYRPRQAPGAYAAPELAEYRPPFPDMPEIEPGAYWYTDDAVMEVVPAGLWMRPPYQAGNPETARNFPCDGEYRLVLFDDATPERAARMRALAGDLLSRMSPTARGQTRVVAVTGSSPDVPWQPDEQSEVAEREPGGNDDTALIGPVAAPSPLTVDSGEVGNAPVEPPPPVASLALEASPDTGDGDADDLARQPAAPVTPVAGADRREPPDSPMPAASPDRTAAPPQAPSGGVPKPEQPEVPMVTGVPEYQPVPEAEAAAVLSDSGLTEERAWLRRTLSREFDSVSSAVSRVISQQPGMRSGEKSDVGALMTDSVAVRLYLSEQGAAVDRGLRSGANGPHVPFARCVASGLNRLPSHRGVVVFAASASPRLLALYRERKLVTEWGFVHAFTSPPETCDGTVDVLLWSMTARRTGLLEPEGEAGWRDRVVFVPGTSFKVLDVADPVAGECRGRVLLRELGSGEIDSNGKVDSDRVSLDELARKSLSRAGEKWGGKKPVAASGRFDVLPGLRVASARQDAPAGADSEGKGDENERGTPGGR